MQHIRTLARKAIAEKLAKFLTKNQRVYLSRPNPLSIPELPAILIYYKVEDPRVIVGSKNYAKIYERDLQLNIDVIIEGCEDPDTILDEYALQIEAAFFDDPTFDGLFNGSMLLSTVPITIEDSGDRNIECMRLTWMVILESEAFLRQRLDEFLVAAGEYTDPDKNKFSIPFNKLLRVRK